jgi:hypothetical protein
MLMVLRQVSLFFQFPSVAEETPGAQGACHPQAQQQSGQGQSAVLFLL